MENWSEANSFMGSKKNYAFYCPIPLGLFWPSYGWGGGSIWPAAGLCLISSEINVYLSSNLVLTLNRLNTTRIIMNYVTMTS